jgi:hypothetical protein
MDWAAWSREAVELMSLRTKEFLQRHGLEPGAPYRWDLDLAEMRMGTSCFGLSVVGTVSGTSFLWSWANEGLPPACCQRVAEVRSFGERNGLSLLSEPCHPGGLTQLKECVAISGRLLDASAVWFHRSETTHLGFVLHERFLQ